MVWRVTATALTSDAEFVYYVDAPRYATESAVVNSAYAEHGVKVRNGDVTEYLSAYYLVEWVEDEH